MTGADAGGGAGWGLKQASIAAAAAAEVTNLFFMALIERDESKHGECMGSISTGQALSSLNDEETLNCSRGGDQMSDVRRQNSELRQLPV